jgi:hypothetical protein
MKKLFYTIRNRRASYIGGLMKRLFALLLLFPALVFAVVNIKDGVSITENTDLDGFTSTIDTCDGQTVAGPGCTEAYDSTGLTDDEVQYVSRYAAREYVGTKMATAAEICICEIEYQTGSLSGFVGGGDNDCTLPDCPDYYAMLFTVDGNDDLSVKLGTSNGIDGDDIADVGSG